MRYCAYLPASFDSDKARRFPVLYYLHGLGDNEQSLLNLGGWDLIEEMRRTGKTRRLHRAGSERRTHVLSQLGRRQDSL